MNGNPNDPNQLGNQQTGYPPPQPLDVPMEGVDDMGQPDPSMMGQMQPEDELEAKKKELETVIATMLEKLNALHEKVNVAEDLDAETIQRIEKKVLDDFDIDNRSREEWMKKMDAAIKLSKMIIAERYYGGEQVASAAYPLIASAAVNFNSRSYPEIVKGTDVVKCQVMGKDDQNLKKKRGRRVADHMSFQILNQMGRWEEDEDSMLMVLPIMGSAFKKTYYDGLNKRNASELVYPEDLVVNYKAKSIESATRISHIIELTQNEIIERMNSGIFLKIPIEQLGFPTPKEAGTPKDTKFDSSDEDAPHTFIEQHCWYDIDGDDYKEPYIVTVHKQSQKLVRIAPRWDMQNVVNDENGDIIRIDPVHYFTRFTFIPSPDGGFYGLGFGTLLSQMNETVNTTINQMIDAGTLQNRPSGFLSKGLMVGRTEGGSMTRLRPGEFRPVSAVGDDLRKAIVPMPTGNPSAILFNLLKFLIESGKELAMMSDVLSGHSPGSNVPAATVVSLIEQGLKVYTGVFKRIHRAHKDEYAKIRRLNKLYLTQEAYLKVLDDPESNIVADYSSDDFDIVPISDPQNATDIQRLMKAQTLLQVMGKGLNDKLILRKYIESLGIEDVDAIMTVKDPMAEKMAQLNLDQLIAQINNMKAQTGLIAEKINTEEVTQAEKAAKIQLEKAALMLESARADDEIIRNRYAEQQAAAQPTEPVAA